jgi:3-(3-hydroxy-phenyl)propionate hydroxylase
VFLAGDSAHQMPPFLGQGMCAGIRDVANLAWKLDAVRQGLADDGLLDTYYAEREPHVRNIIQRAVQAGRIIQTTDPAVADARDRMFLDQGTPELIEGRTSVRRDVVIGEGGIEARMPGLVDGVLDPKAASGGPAGQTFPQSLLPDGKRTDDLLGEGFAVVAGEDAAALLTDSVRRAWSDIGARFVQPSLPPGDPLATWLAEHGAAVVRPDRYVYGVARCEEDLLRLASALRPQLQGVAATAQR